MNDPEASLAVKASRGRPRETRWGGGGKGTRCEALATAILELGGSGLHYAVATWDPRSAPCLGAYFIR